MAKFYNLILCGGIGSRLWPLSSPRLPKQFADLLSGPSLFQEAVKRNRDCTDSLIIAANAQQTALAKQQLVGLGANLRGGVVEPVGRNTAPAIILAAMDLDPDDVLLITPADHAVTDVGLYGRVVRTAKAYAEMGYIVTFGIDPESPATGYGYIRSGERLHAPEHAVDTAVSAGAVGNDLRASVIEPGMDVFSVESFTEKPDRKTAETYLQEGKYTWNSGMFCAKVSTLLAEIRLYRPEITDACNTVYQSSVRDEGGFLHPRTDSMMKIPAVSIDYALMEHTKKAAVIPSNFGWSDIGSYESLYEVLAAGGNAENGNVILGNPAGTPGSSGNLVISAERKRVVLIGVEDLIVVETESGLLVTKKGYGQEVGKYAET